MMNPEFQRQLWLNWRPALLLWSALLVALTLALALVLSPEASRLPNAAMVASLGLWGSALAYGALLAGRSLREEASEHTWDWQRLSALGPWRMAWGKLLGATLPAWLYVGWFALAALVLVPRLGPSGSGLIPAPHLVALALLWGLAAQAWTMNMVLLPWRPGQDPGSKRQPLALFGLIALWLGFSLAMTHDSPGVRASRWWGAPIGPLALAYLCGLLALALGALTLWRQLCERLDLATLPWAWPLGLALVACLGAGFARDPGEDLFLYLCTVGLAATALIALQRMPLHAHAWRQVQWCLQRRRWQGVLRALPLWPVSWLMALLAALAPLAREGNDGWIAVVLCLQVLRDALLLTGFALQYRRYKSPLVVFLVTWLVLSLALPLLARGLGWTWLATALQPFSALVLHAQGLNPLAEPLPWLFLTLHLLAVAFWVRQVHHRQMLAMQAAAAPAGEPKA